MKTALLPNTNTPCGTFCPNYVSECHHPRKAVLSFRRLFWSIVRAVAAISAKQQSQRLQNFRGRRGPVWWKSWCYRLDVAAKPKSGQHPQRSPPPSSLSRLLLFSPNEIPNVHHHYAMVLIPSHLQCARRFGALAEATVWPSIRTVFFGQLPKGTAAQSRVSGIFPQSLTLSATRPS